MTQEHRNALRRSVMLHEGLRLKPYRDSVGKLSLGFGRNLDDVGITRDEALFLLENDLSTAIRECERAFPWFSDLDGVRQSVVAELLFNMGSPTLRKFKHTLAAIESGNYAGAARGMLESKWASQVGARAVRLAEMMRTGIDPAQERL